MKKNLKNIIGTLALFTLGIFFVRLVIISIDPSYDTTNNSMLRKRKAEHKQYTPNNSKYNIIEYSLREASIDLHNSIDVNNDNKINCIDAAVLFYKYFPEKDKVTIELNYNPVTGMNHLFNCVYLDGVWHEIEPQSYWRDFSSYWMIDIWGSQYDKSKNKDVTQDYLRYVK